MKTIYFTVIPALLLSAAVCFGDEPVNEPVEPPVQEQAQDRYQYGIDQDEVAAAVQAMRQAGFSDLTQVDVQQTIEEALEEGLPVKPLTHKVHEGIVKNIPEDRIVDAVQSVRQRYRHAYGKASELEVEPDQEEPLGDMIAGAYAAGLTYPECDRIMAALLRTRTRTRTRSQNQQELYIQTMATARTMARRGVSPETISEVLVKALEFSYQPDDMRRMRRAFVQNSQYRTPEQTARRYAERLSQGVDPTNLSVAGVEGDQNDDPGGSRGGRGGPGGDSAGAGNGDGAGSSGGNGGGSGGSNSNSGGSGGSDDSSGGRGNSGSNSGSGGKGSGSSGGKRR